MILIFKNKKISDKGTERTIEILQEKLQERSAKADVVSFDEIELYVDQNDVKAVVGGKDLSLYTTIFFRRVGDHRNRAHIIALLAKKLGIPVLDKLYDVTNEPGKLKQTVVLAMNNISVPKTYFSGEYSAEKVKNAIDFLGLPIVAKTSKGRKGKGVYLANTKEELEKIAAENEDGEVLLQEFIPNDFDYRILVLGEETACVEKRIRTDENEFRNNVAVGAREEFIAKESVDEKILNLAIQAAKVANIQIAGVDIVTDFQGESYVFEVNRAPAFTHDDNVSNELNSLADYLSKCDRKTS